MKIIAVANQKGGVGKTTTAVNLAASLAVAERRVLLIDMDPQGNAGSGLGVPTRELTASVYHALLGAETLGNVVRATDLKYLFVAPSNLDLIGAEVELRELADSERRLKRCLVGTNGFDYVLIDCPPSLGLLTINALAASGSFIIPLQCEYYALEGLSDLLRTVERIRGRLNAGLRLEGILLTMFDGRNNLSHQVAAEVRKHFERKLFHTVIPRNVRLGECPSHGQPIITYDAGSRGAQSYLALGREILAREGSEEQA